MVARAVGYIVVTYRAYPEGKQWVSECPELAVISCGDTLQEALDNIADATGLYLNTIEQQGERERVFRERGIPVWSARPKKDEFPILRGRAEEVIRPHVERVLATV
jgi:predicted RNase H-like HicB family nuclease